MTKEEIKKFKRIIITLLPNLTELEICIYSLYAGLYGKRKNVEEIKEYIGLSETRIKKYINISNNKLTKAAEKKLYNYSYKLEPLTKDRIRKALTIASNNLKMEKEYYYKEELLKYMYVLSPYESVTINLHYFGHPDDGRVVTIKEISEYFNCTQDTIKNRISNAHRKMKEAKEQGRKPKESIKLTKEEINTILNKKNNRYSKSKVDYKTVFTAKQGLLHYMSYANEAIIRIQYDISAGEHNGITDDEIGKLIYIDPNTIENRKYVSYNRINKLSSKAKNEKLEPIDDIITKARRGKKRSNPKIYYTQL